MIFLGILIALAAGGIAGFFLAAALSASTLRDTQAAYYKRGHRDGMAGR